MSAGESPIAAATVATDGCALALARRMAALLDRDPGGVHEGDPLPHGWHAMLFNLPTRQSELRADGSADLGVALPELGLPRLMLAGRQNRFPGEIPIGCRVRRESRAFEPRIKEGRSGRFALVRVEHRIFVEGEALPAVEETLEYVLREAAAPAPAPSATATTAPSPAASVEPIPAPLMSRVLLPDSRLLFRYSGITDNPHRIHYDLPYARGEESYPDLVVNGSIPAMFLLEMFRAAAGREPRSFSSRNVAPMFCNQPLRLCLRKDETDWHLWAEDSAGRTTFDARAD